MSSMLGVSVSVLWVLLSEIGLLNLSATSLERECSIGMCM